MADKKKANFKPEWQRRKGDFAPFFGWWEKRRGKRRAKPLEDRYGHPAAEQWSDMMRGDWGKNNEWPLKGTCEPSRGWGCQPGFACCSSGHKGSKINEISSSLEIRELTILSLLNVEWTHYCREKRPASEASEAAEAVTLFPGGSEKTTHKSGICILRGMKP